MPRPGRPSPALLVAVLALLVALTGSAVAGVPGRIASAISGRTIKDRSIAGAKLRDNTLTGRQIAERKLGTVPKAKAAGTATSAKNATTAGTALKAGDATTVGGMSVRKFFLAAPNGTTDTPLLTLDGLTLHGHCEGGVPKLTATTDTDDSELNASVVTFNGAGKSAFDSDFDRTDTANLLAGAGRGQGTAGYARRDGKVVTLVYGFDTTPALGNASEGAQACAIYGTATGG